MSHQKGQYGRAKKNVGLAENKKMN